MSKRFALIAAAFGALTLTSALIAPVQAQDKMMSGAKMNEKTVMVGGAPMYPSKDIIDNAVNSKDHTTLVAAVKAAGLVETLKGAGPFTVFAPTNAAFTKLPAGTVDTLLKPENKGMLVKVLTYHVVPGRLSAQDLAAKVDQGGGRAMLTTVEGDTLIIMRSGKSHLTVTDAKGDVAMITIANVFQSNGVIHVIDTVLQPAS
ncbi:MAG: fasciclin domain-containing protein [Methylobacteriaceae bacterium]|nr:fasciclin domain-containing protein [Methylobacteriaceae bacterium]